MGALLRDAAPAAGNRGALTAASAAPSTAGSVARLLGAAVGLAEGLARGSVELLRFVATEGVRGALLGEEAARAHWERRQLTSHGCKDGVKHRHDGRAAFAIDAFATTAKLDPAAADRLLPLLRELQKKWGGVVNGVGGGVGSVADGPPNVDSFVLDDLSDFSSSSSDDED